LRTEDGIAVSFPGSLLSAWRRQLPRRAPGKSVRSHDRGPWERYGRGPRTVPNSAHRASPTKRYGLPPVTSGDRQDEVREDREHRFTRRALYQPDGDPAQPDTRIMRMARQAPSPATRRLMFELQANGEEKGEDTFDKRLTVCNQVQVGRVVSKVDSDSAVFSRRFGCCAYVSSPCYQAS
jgi:hypothetical protein